MSPRESAQLALDLATSELALSEEKRVALVSALAELLLAVARAQPIEVLGEEDGDELEANT